MNSNFLILIGLLTILNVNYAWNNNAKGNQSPIPKPFWQNTGPVKSNRNYQQQSSSSSYQQQQQQDEASAEPTPQIPQTSFTCNGKPYNPGMYGDEETGCRVYHVCVEDKKDSFFCGEGTVFNQKILTCDYPKDTDCAASQRYWSANEELGKPGAEPSPGGQNQVPISPAKTRQNFNQQTKQQIAYQPQQPVKQYQPQQQQIAYQPQQPVKQYQHQPQQQQPVKQYQPQPNYQQQQPQKQYEDNGFVDEPVKKIRPTYKVVKTPQQPIQYQPQPNYQSSPPKVYISPSKSKITQQAIPLDQLGPSNYQQQETYQQSDSYFSQEQSMGNWKPSRGPIRQQPVKQTSSNQQYYTQQQQISQPSNRQSKKQQYYSQSSNSQNGWKASNGGGYSSNEITEQKIDVNIPKTNFICEDKPYSPGMYADMEINCSVYHVCFDGRKESFACGLGTVFSQKLLTCDYPEKVDCRNSPNFYSANTNLVREQGSWVLKQSNQKQQNNSNDGWSSNQRKIK